MPIVRQAHHQADQNFILKDGEGYKIKARGLNITWGRDSRYWTILENGEAELKQVSWLDVSGKVRVEGDKKYQIQFDVKVKDDGFGWSGTKVMVMAKLGKGGKYDPRAVFLEPGDELSIPSSWDRQLTISVPLNAPDLDLYFGLYEVWSGKWKGGLVIKGAKVIELPQ